MHKLSKSYADICAIYHQVMALFLPTKLCPYDYFFTSYEQAVCKEAAAARHKLRGGQRI